ncbi:hypothetical protein bcgnr5380_41980 [Bacillus cereus]
MTKRKGESPSFSRYKVTYCSESKIICRVFVSIMRSIYMNKVISLLYEEREALKVFKKINGFVRETKANKL